MTHRFIPVDPFDLVIFGATGDLAQRKLLPGLYHRDMDGQLPDDARIIGCARSKMEADAFRTMARQAIIDHVPPGHLENETLERFLARLDYVTNDVSDAAGWDAPQD
jgi:glucose-6-phosphate 1-dehydrogenase